jgi:hypothetical protein
MISELAHLSKMSHRLLASSLTTSGLTRSQRREGILPQD